MISKLKQELATGEYSGMTDQQVADTLNAHKDVPQIYMLTDVRLAAAIGTAKTVACIEALKAQGDAVSLWIVDKLATTGLDIGNEEAPALIQPLIDGGVITQADADIVLALGKTTTTEAKQIGINDTVMAYHVTEARNG